MAGPLYILRQIQELKYGNGIVATIATFQSLTALFGSYLGGYASSRFGYRYVLLFSTLFSAIPPLIWAFSSQLVWLIRGRRSLGFNRQCLYDLFLLYGPRRIPR